MKHHLCYSNPVHHARVLLVQIPLSQFSTDWHRSLCQNRNQCNPNQNFNDIFIEINTLKIKTISDLTNLLLLKLKKKKSTKIRLFFKGRPLKSEEELNTLRKKILYKNFL